MENLICPLDGKPCEQDCPDRYHDQPEGGCVLTTFLELGGNILFISKRGEQDHERHTFEEAQAKASDAVADLLASKMA